MGSEITEVPVQDGYIDVTAEPPIPTCENMPFLKRLYEWAVANNRTRIAELCKRICERGKD